jgi:hypothetical protein
MSHGFDDLLAQERPEDHSPLCPARRAGLPRPAREGQQPHAPARVSPVSRRFRQVQLLAPMRRYRGNVCVASAGRDQDRKRLSCERDRSHELARGRVVHDHGLAARRDMTRPSGEKTRRYAGSPCAIRATASSLATSTIALPPPCTLPAQSSRPSGKSAMPSVKGTACAWCSCADRPPSTYPTRHVRNLPSN